MSRRSSMRRRHFPQVNGPSRLELIELESRDQPALLNVTLPIISVDLFSVPARAATTFSANSTTENAAISVRDTGTAAATLDISVTEIVGSVFTSLIITITPEVSSAPPISTTPMTPSAFGTTGGTAAPLSVPASGAETTPFAPVAAQGTIGTGVGTELHGAAIAPTSTTPFVVVAESPAIRGGGPTSDTVAPRVAGSTTGVLGPPTATNLSAGGLGGVYELIGPHAPPASTTPAPTGNGPAGAEAAIPAAPPSLAKPGATTGGDQVEQSSDTGAVAKLAAAKPWLQRYGRSAALTALAAAAGGYGVIRWRRSRALKRVQA